MNLPPQNPKGNIAYQAIHLSYIIAATPRSGSSLLSALLRCSGIAGLPEEYIVFRNSDLWRGKLGYGNHRDYFQAYCSIRLRTPNGVLGAKLMWPQFVALCSDARKYLRCEGMTDAGVLDLVLPELRFVRLTRQNKIRQAVSLAKALKTGAWSGQQSGMLVVPYEFAAVSNALLQIHAQEKSWALFFSSIQGLRTFEVIYEEFITDLGGTQRRLLSWLGLDPDLALGNDPRFDKQADGDSEKWVEQFKHDISRLLKNSKKFE